MRRGAKQVALGLLLTITCAACGSSQAVAPGAAGAKRTWRSGVFAGYGPAKDLAFAAWRGSPIQTATDFPPSNTWAQLDDPAGRIRRWGAVPSVTPDLSLAMWPWSGGSLAAAASGAYDSYFRTLAHNLVAGGLARASIRLGWEFNGTWSRWSVRTATDAAHFAEAWRRIVTAMRSVPGQQLSFDWAPTIAVSGLDPALSYPGDAYVTDVGLDVYDWNEAAKATPTQRWNAIVNRGYGLAWQARFAAAHRKPIAFPEWGLAYNPRARAASGGDDQMFIRNMYAWFGSHNTSFENYFDADDPALHLFFGINTGNGYFPQAAGLYRRLYGGSA